MTISNFFSLLSSAYKLYTAHKDDLAGLADELKTVFGRKDDSVARAWMSAREAREIVSQLGLSVSDRWGTLSDADLESICNGFGPDAWPEGLRSVATWWYRNLQPADKIHDVEYQFSDGTKEGWHTADNRFSENGSKILSYRYPIVRVDLWPERAALWAKKHLAIRLLAIGGWDAYKAAYLRRTDIPINAAH
jgi:hypothetical protein